MIRAGVIRLNLRPPAIAAALSSTADPDRLLQTWLTEPPTFDEV